MEKSLSPAHKYDTIVVGGSFAGLSAAMQLVRARRRVLMIDSGRPRNRFAAASHGFLGQDGRSPAVIRADGRAQLERYPTFSYLEGEVTDGREDEGGFAFDLADGGSVFASRVILATGVRDELPDIAGLQERWGSSVFHCPYCHGFEVGDRQLGVIASHPMSSHQAQLLSDWGPVTFFTQGVYEPDESEQAALAARGVRIEREPVVECLGPSGRIDAVRLADGRTIAIDAVFTATKLHLASPLAERLGCAIDSGPFGPVVRVDDMKQTSVPGVFAAGDMSTAMTNATLASASGVMAGVGAHRSLIF